MCDEPTVLIQLLTDRQHLHPHESLAATARVLESEIGCCPQAIARAMEWLSLESSRTIGRLRRGELLQLARSIHRFWRQSVTTDITPLD